MFSSTSDGLTPYDVNVVTSTEAAGTSNAHVIITVADDAPNELFVYCGNHGAGMGFNSNRAAGIPVFAVDLV